MAYNGVQIDNSPNIIVITDSDANQITVTQPITRTVEVAALGPQGPVGPQGPSGSFDNISGSFLYTSSFNAFTASYNTGSFTGSFTGVANLTSFSASSAVVTGNVTVLGTASINTLIVNQTQLSTGSNQLGDAANDTQTLYGTVRIPTGSLTVSGSSFFTGSLNLGTGTVIYGDTTNPSLVLDQTTGAYLKYGTTSEVTVQGSTAILKASNTVQLRTGTTTHLFVTSSGNIGIGTLTPSTRLDVAGGDITVDVSRGIIFRSTTGYVKYNGSQLYNVSADSYDSNGYFRVRDNTGVNTRFIVLDNGNVGIGTATPSTRLHVIGSGITSSTAALLVQNANASASLAILDDGSIGIGTTTPTAKLEIRATGSNETTQRWLDNEGKLLGDFSELGDAGILRIGYVISSISTNRPLITLDGGAGNSSAGIYLRSKSSTNNIRIASDISSYISGSNLALGFINPAANAILHISGAANDNIFRVDTPTVPYTLFVTGSGNVGIGVTSPQARLHISSSATATPTLLVGRASGQSSIKAGPDAIGNYLSLDSSGTATLINHYVSDNVWLASGGGSVAVGHNSPLARLHVKGTGATSSTTALLVQNANASSSLVVLDDGKVGIGTTSPAAELHINGNTTSYLHLTNTTSGGTINDGMTVGVNTSNYFVLVREAAPLYFGTSATERMRILSTGEVGIGTSTPTASLHISGASSANLLRIDSPASSSILFVSGSGNVGIGTNNPINPLHVVSTDGRGIRVTNVGGGQDALLITNVSSLVRWSNGSYIGSNSYYTQTLDTQFQTFDGSNVVTRLFIKASNGFIGLGTTTPSASLHISGSSGSALLKVDSDASSSILSVRGSGNVGIGTSDPINTFTIQTTTNTLANQPIVSAVSGATFAGWLIYTGSSERARYAWNTTDGAYVYTPSTDPFTIYTNGTRALRINSSQNVGIGTDASTPAARLHVKGAGSTSNSTGLLVENASSAPAFTITDDLNARFYGNVGVRVTPSASFHVAGNTILSGSAGTGSALTVYKSGSTVMSIQGSQGELFSITDSLSGSLFSVSNISGLPILEVFSDNTVLLGSYLDPMLMTTQRVTANSGSTVIYSLPTSSYDGVFVDYVIRSGSNARAGQFMGLWSGSTANFTDNSTTDFGSTSGFIFGLTISGSNMVLTGSASTSGWTVRAGIRSI